MGFLYQSRYARELKSKLNLNFACGLNKFDHHYQKFPVIILNVLNHRSILCSALYTAKTHKNRVHIKALIHKNN